MTSVTWLFGSLLGGWLVLRRVVGDRWGWLGLLNSWAEWGSVVLAGLAGLAALRRRWRQSGALLTLAAIGAPRRPGSFPWLPAALSESPPASYEQRPLLTLFDANLLYRRESGVEGHVALIRRHRPDVICLQELAPRFAAALLDALAADYPFQVFRPQQDAYGLGVLSRFPLRETGFWDQPGVEPWCQRVQVMLPDGQQVDVYNAHLAPPLADSTLEQGTTWGFRTREAQVRALQNEMAEQQRPACVVGDFNFADTADAYRIAREQLHDGWAGAGHGARWTWPMRSYPGARFPALPLLRLDYCLHNEGLAPLAMQVLRAQTGSDHAPLLVTFAVAPCSD